MIKRVLYILLTIMAVMCMSLKPDKHHRVGSIEVLRIKNENLLPVLDSIISHEKRCVYYMSNLFFSIRSWIINDTISKFQIEAFGTKLIESNDDHPKGCFEYNGHWFFVEGEELDESVFAKTNQKKRFLFYKPTVITDDGKIILYSFENDTYSIWIYHYVNDTFLLREMYDTYCKSD